MGYKHDSLPCRMLRYMADILEYLSGRGLPRLPIAQVADLMSVMGILAEERFTRQFLRKFIRREQLMRSLLFEEWAEEIISETKLEDAANMLREGISVAKVARIIKLPVEKIRALNQEIMAAK